MNVDAMFPARYLRGQDLAGPILIVITAITREKMRAGPGKPEEEKYVLRFELVKGQTIKLDATQHPPEGYGLILRKVLAHQIVAALMLKDADKWIGQRIVIFPGPSKAAGEDVITTYARAPRAATVTSAPTTADTTHSGEPAPAKEGSS